MLWAFLIFYIWSNYALTRIVIFFIYFLSDWQSIIILCEQFCRVYRLVSSSTHLNVVELVSCMYCMCSQVLYDSTIIWNFILSSFRTLPCHFQPSGILACSLNLLSSLFPHTSSWAFIRDNTSVMPTYFITDHNVLMHKASIIYMYTTLVCSGP